MVDVGGVPRGLARVLFIVTTMLKIASLSGPMLGFRHTSRGAEARWHLRHSMAWLAVACVLPGALMSAYFVIDGYHERKDHALRGAIAVLATGAVADQVTRWFTTDPNVLCALWALLLVALWWTTTRPFATAAFDVTPTPRWLLWPTLTIGAAMGAGGYYLSEAARTPTLYRVAGVLRRGGLIDAVDLEADRSEAAAIVAMTRAGKTARMLSSLRPAARILAATPSARVAAQLALTWGVVPLVTPAPSIADVRGALHMARLVTDGDIVVFVSMHPKLGPDGRNYIHVERV